jgi:hypothetical protein
MAPGGQQPEGEYRNGGGNDDALEDAARPQQRPHGRQIRRPRRLLGLREGHPSPQ